MYACLCVQQHAAPASAGGRDLGTVLLAVAREFSPRVEPAGAFVAVCDLAGVERLFGDTKTIAGELRREAADRGVPVRVAIAGTRTAALVAAHAHPGITIVPPGGEAVALAPLPVRLLDVFLDLEVGRLEAGQPPAPARFYRTSPMQEMARQRLTARRRSRVSLTGASREALDRHERLLETFDRWGITTLGALAALPRAEVASRFGKDGPRLQRLARGEDEGPLVPAAPDERFETHLDLEWPIDGLEPLSFVLGRLLEPVCAHLERRDRAAAALVVDLRLVSKETFTRRLPLPAPIRDSRALRTLALLDLDAHPPGAGIDAVTVRIEPTPGRVLQYSLLERAQPAPEQLSTLVARLGAVMGPDRVGSPQVPDSYRPGAFVLQPFAVARGPRGAEIGRVSAAAAPASRLVDVSRSPHGEGGTSVAPASAAVSSSPGAVIEEAPIARRPVAPALRRFRHPVPIRVAVEDRRPARVVADRPGLAAGHVEACAGPWRTSGSWWRDGWDRDEWDVALDDGTVCRVYRDRTTQGWFMDGIVD